MNRRELLALLAAGPALVEPTRAYSFIWAPPTLHDNWKAACRMAFGPSVDASKYHHDAFGEIFSASVGPLKVAVEAMAVRDVSVADLARHLRGSYDSEMARRMARIFPS